VAQINPLGFALEGFDALGRVRSEQALYDGNGKLLGTKPVDTASVPRVRMDDTTPASGAVDLARMIADSGKVEACFAREYVRYTAARVESEATDGCELEAIRSALDRGQGILDALRAFALLPSYRQRFVPAS
jgi:hypothetical protein